MQYRVQKDDNVIVRTGRDKGKIAKVLRVVNKHRKVFVDGVNVVKRHTRANPHLNQTGGIIEKELGIDLSNVMLFCIKCNKGVRIGYRLDENNKKIRFCKKCNTKIEK